MMRRVRSLIRDRFHWILGLSAAVCVPAAILLITLAGDIGAGLVMMVAVALQLGMAVQILRLRTLRRELARSEKAVVRRHRQVMKELQRLGRVKQPPVADGSAQWRRVRDTWSDSIGVLRLDAELHHRDILQALAGRRGDADGFSADEEATPSSGLSEATTAGSSLGRRGH